MDLEDKKNKFKQESTEKQEEMKKADSSEKETSYKPEPKVAE